MMATRYRLRGLTLWETLFLVVALVVFFAILRPALFRVRRAAHRMTCGTNLAGIGKAMLIYANDYADELPRAGGPGGSWATRTPNWMGQNRFEAYGIALNSRTGGQASISASLYLLVKYAEVAPKSFVCTENKGVTEFSLTRIKGLPKGFMLIDAWDFGAEAPKHVSYAYHMPYGSRNVTIERDPGMAIAADRNPWMDSLFAKAQDFSKFRPNGTTDQIRAGNTIAHRGDGQNVLFLDWHVEFAKVSSCGIDDDNVYTSWDGDDKTRGQPAKFGSVPADPNDSLLVNDPAVAPETK